MPPKNLFPALCASIVYLLASTSSSGKRFGVSAQNTTVTVPARPLYFRVPGDADFGSPGGSTCGNSYCSISESCCNKGMGNSATATPDNPAPDSVNSAATATLYKTSTTTLISGTAIVIHEPATILTPNNEPSEVQLQAVTASGVASMNKGLLPTMEYDPLDCSWFYFCTNFATISGTSTQVTYLCSSLYITHVMTQAITDSGPSTVYTTTTAYTTVTPTSYTTETPITSARLESSTSTVTPASTSTSTSTSTSASTSISTTTEYLSITHYRVVTVTRTSATNNSVLYVETGFSPFDTGNVLAPLGTGQSLAPRAAERVTTVTTTVTFIVTTVTVTTTEVIETEILCTTVKSTLLLPSSGILTSQSSTASTSQNLSKTASSGTSELPASTIAGMSFLQRSSSSIMSMLNSVVSATSLLSSSGSGMMLLATSTVMSSAMTSNSGIMGTGSTAISSNSILTPNITPPVSLCYDSEHNTNGPCSKASSTGYYPGASVVPLGSNAFAGQKISCLVVSLVLAIHLALRV